MWDTHAADPRRAWHPDARGVEGLFHNLTCWLMETAGRMSEPIEFYGGRISARDALRTGWLSCRWFSENGESQNLTI